MERRFAVAADMNGETRMLHQAVKTFPNVINSQFTFYLLVNELITTRALA